MTIDPHELLHDAGRTPPPSGIDVTQAAARGRTLRKRHRLMQVGAAAVTLLAGLSLSWAALVTHGTPSAPSATGGDAVPVLTQRVDSGIYMQARISGALHRRGPCLTLVDGPSETVVIWPPATRWSVDDEVLVLPDGLRVAQGEEIAGTGGYLSADRRDLGRTYDSDFVNRAIECSKLTDGRIATINLVTKR